MQALESAFSAACASYDSSPGIQLALVVFFAMTMGALPLVFSRGKNAPVVADSFLAHLGELRWRLLRVLSWMLATFFILPLVLGAFSIACEGESSWGGWLFTFWRWLFEGAGEIYGIFAAPLLEKLPDSGEIIAIGMVSPILVPMKATFFVTACAMMPFILFEAWKFIAPGLYDTEKGIARPLIATSATLFYVGIAFAYFLVFQVVFEVIAVVTPDTVNWTPDINELLGGMLLMFFAFGLVFELPVAMFILARVGVVEPNDMRKARPYVIIGSFVVAAIVTPPDIWSQIIFACLCWALYEVGLLFTSKWGKKKEKAPDEESA